MMASLYPPGSPGHLVDLGPVAKKQSCLLLPVPKRTWQEKGCGGGGGRNLSFKWVPCTVSHLIASRDKAIHPGFLEAREKSGPLF